MHRIVKRNGKRNGPVCTAEGAVVNRDCQHVRELMDSYLSEELSVETNHGVLRHVAQCRDCAAELRRRRRLRALLSNARRRRGRRSREGTHHARHGSRASLVGSRRTTRGRCRDACRGSRRRVLGGQAVDAAAYDDSAEDHIACALTYRTMPRTTSFARPRTSSHRSSISSTPLVFRTAPTT